MLAFTLPDHGAATPEIGADWAAHQSWELVDAASDAAGRDVAALLLAPREDEALIEHAHLATFVLSLVAVDAAERLGLAPMAVSGYGLGEYTALVSAGALSFEDGVRLVLERGIAMREELIDTPCATVEIHGLDDDDVEAACARAEGDAWVAGYDAPGQVVVSGTTEGVQRAASVARSLGATRVVPLASRDGIHTPLLSRARDRLRKSLAAATFAEADPVVVSNVDARHHADPAEWPGLLSAQLCAPVRWRRSVDALFAEGVRTFVEFGAGATLAASTRRCFPSKAVQAYTISSPADLEALVDRLIATPSLRRRAVADHDQLAGRLIVSPAAGPFQPVDDVVHAAPRLAGIPVAHEGPAGAFRVDVGDLIGWVGDAEVRSAFAGTLGGLLVIAGERVMPSQPVAWLDARSET